MKEYLLYTLLNYNIKPYLEMFKSFLESILLYSSLEDFDILIICSKSAHRDLLNIPIVKKFSNIKYFEIPESKDLYHALLNKCEIANYEDAPKYKKILYLDCDIIVKCDLAKIFKKTSIKPELLYASEEGTLTGKYWYLNSYKESNITRLEKEGVKSFNTGTFMFIPTKTFLKHFKNVKKLAETFKGEKHFYDQSFFNYYFNIHNLSCTDFITDMVKMFPDPEKHYPNKCFLHFAGLGRYNEKAKIMKKYLKMLRLVMKSK